MNTLAGEEGRAFWTEPRARTRVRAWRGWASAGRQRGASELPEPVQLPGEGDRGWEREPEVGGPSCVLQRTGLVLGKDRTLPRKTVLWAQLPRPVGLSGGSGNRKGERSKRHVLGAKGRVGRPPGGPSRFLRISSSLLPVCWRILLLQDLPPVFSFSAFVFGV